MTKQGIESANEWRRSGAARPVVGRRRPMTRGFTIIEILVVILIITALLAWLLPTLSSGREAGYMAVCASNESQLHRALITNRMESRYFHLPNAGEWVNFVVGKNAAKALRCPKGKPPELTSALEGLYICQRHSGGNITFTYILDVLAGKPGTDPQIFSHYKGQTRGSTSLGFPAIWNAIGGQPPADSPILVIGVDDDVLLTIDLGTMMLTEWDPPQSPNQCRSDHWLGRGFSMADPRVNKSEIILSLTGESQRHIPAPITIPLGGGVGSYGMNNQTDDARSRPEQLLLLDYEKTIVDVDGAGSADDDFDKSFAPRHLGKANVLLVSGAIRQRSRSQLLPADAIWKLEPK
jgi:prepilin-type N-terminal cleavage/methylation domain-containing protein